MRSAELVRVAQPIGKRFDDALKDLGLTSFGIARA
jgi:hypothetical protein